MTKIDQMFTVKARQEHQAFLLLRVRSKLWLIFLIINVQILILINLNTLYCYYISHSKNCE